ncbi:MAG: DUF6923 family protein, partial [Acidimicrobiales bacterium]
MTTSPRAGAGAAFTCATPTIFLAQTEPTQLYDSLYGAGKTTFSKIGTTHGWNYNAMGYDPSNKYLYAVSLPSTNKSYPAGHLLQVGSTGLVQDLGAISGDSLLTKDGAVVGAFDGSGNFWVTSSTNPVVDEVSVSSSPPKVLKKVTVTPAGSWHPADFTWDGGFMWGMGPAGKTDDIYRLNLTTGAVNSFAAPSSIGTGAIFGAAWTYGNGNLGFDNNTTGSLYQVSVTNPSAAKPTFAVISSYSGPVANNSDDGAACIPTPANLSITNSAPSTATVDASVSWVFRVTNLGKGISSGYVINDTLPAGVSAATTPSAGCTVTGTVLTCDEGELKVGASATYTVAADAPVTGGVCITDTVKVTGNEEDPVPKNNSATAKTCTTKAAPTVGADKPTPASGVPGKSFEDKATLSGGVAVTGTMSFKLYGPTQSTCTGTPQQTVTTPVTGDGQYTSPTVVISTAGSYHWMATYGGNASDKAASTTCASGVFTVAKAGPTLAAETPTPDSGVPGASFADEVTLSGGSAPTGTISFAYYSSSTCTGTPIGTITTTVHGDGTYTSPTVAVSTVGSYWWVASYGGDVANAAAATPCADGSFTVVKASPTLGSETPTPTSGDAGSGFADEVTLAGGISPTGTISYELFGPTQNTCTGTPEETVTTTVDGDGEYTSPSVTITTVGDYWWVAGYAGDDANNAATRTPCAKGLFSVVTPPPGTCTINWAGPSSGGQWSTTSNWDLGRLPTTGDVVCIGTSGSTFTGPVVFDDPNGSNLTSIAQLKSYATLDVQAGELLITDTSSTAGEQSFVDGFDMSGGQLGDTNTNSANLGDDGTFTWTGGDFYAPETQSPQPVLGQSGAGAAFIQNGAYLDNWNLDLDGHLTFGSGSIEVEYGGSITESAAVTVDTGVEIYGSGGPGLFTITSSGSLTMNASGDTFYFSMPFAISGPITMTAGTLNFVTYGGSVANFTVASGATIEFDTESGMQVTISGGSTNSGAGTVLTAGGGTIDAAAALDVANVTIDGCTVTATGGASISGLLLVEGGELDPTGSRAFGVGSFRMTGGDLGDTTVTTTVGITDDGTFTWTGGDFYAPTAESPQPVVTQSGAGTAFIQNSGYLDNWNLDLDGNLTIGSGYVYFEDGGSITESAAVSVASNVYVY